MMFGGRPKGRLLRGDTGRPGAPPRPGRGCGRGGVKERRPRAGWAETAFFFKAGLKRRVPRGSREVRRLEELREKGAKNDILRGIGEEVEGGGGLL